MWSPKARYLKDAASSVKAHADLVDQVIFQEGAEIAMLQMIAEMSDTTDPVIAAAGYHRIMGARTFLSHLYNVSRPSAPPPPKQKAGNLDHTV